MTDNQNNNHLSGGKYLAAGSYGTVFKPPIRCLVNPKGKSAPSNLQPKDPHDSQRVGKVFKEVRAFESELKLDQLVAQHFSAFTLPHVKACNIRAPTKVDLAGLAQARNHNIVTPHKGDNQIIYPDGGLNLSVYCKQHVNKTYPMRVKTLVEIFKGLKPIIHGLSTMLKHNVIHQDIKPLNIVYNKKTKECRLIDWGLMDTNMKELYTLERVANNGLLGYPYPYYPVEFQILHYILDRNRIPNVDELMHLLNTQLKYHLTFYHIVLKKSREPVRERNVPSISQQEYYQLFHIDCLNELRRLSDDLRMFQTLDNILTYMTNFTHTIDAYSIGMSLAEIFMSLALHTSDGLDIDPRVFIIRMFIRDLIHPHPEQRMKNADTIIKRYQEAVNLITKNK